MKDASMKMFFYRWNFAIEDFKRAISLKEKSFKLKVFLKNIEGAVHVFAARRWKNDVDRA